MKIDPHDVRQQRGRFIAVLAHELRNPIAPIRSGLELLAGRQLSEEERARTISIMQRQVSHLVRLVDDLLDAARVDAGVLVVDLRPLPIKEVLKSALETVEPAIRAKSQRLVVEENGPGAVVRADPVRLSQAIANLLSSSVKKSEPGSEVRVRVHAEATSVVVAVEDARPATSDAELEALLDPYSFARSTRADDGLGIGLGLVRGLLALHDGVVDVRALPTGAEFIIRLPRVELAVADEQAVRAEPPLRHSRRILVVDDNVEAAKMLSLLLELDGHTLRVAYDGPTAVTEAADFEPEVIFMDLGLPQMGGLEAVRLIRLEGPLVRPYVIALTGWGSASDREATATAGFDKHLVKPVDIDLARATIAGLPRGTASSHES